LLRVVINPKEEVEMSDLEKKAVELLDKIEVITTNYAPDVTEAAIQAVRVSAISELVTCLTGFILLGVGVFAGRKLINFFVRKKEEDGYWSDWEIGYGISSLIVVIVGVIGGLEFAFGITDVWMWTTIFNPELGLAHKLSGL